MQRFIITSLAVVFCVSLAYLATAQSPKPRKLAPGVVTVIQPKAEEADTFSGPREMVEIVQGFPELDWQPNYAPKNETLLERAKKTFFRRDTWYLEFGFKPLRMIKAPVRAADGTVREELVWYLCYYVKNNGNHLSPAPQKDDFGSETFAVGTKSHPVRFTPTFLLRSYDRRKAYLDRILPEALALIRQREDPAIQFHDSVSISDVMIPVSTETDVHKVWGVATWVHVDPQTDYFSVYVEGLTNAYRWQDPAGAFKKGDRPGTGRRLSQKTLKLNYWRPGDEIDQHEREIRYGLPTAPKPEQQAKVLQIYRQREPLDHLWVYR